MSKHYTATLNTCARRQDVKYNHASNTNSLSLDSAILIVKGVIAEQVVLLAYPCIENKKKYSLAPL